MKESKFNLDMRKTSVSICLYFMPFNSWICELTWQLWCRWFRKICCAKSVWRLGKTPHQRAANNSLLKPLLKASFWHGQVDVQSRKNWKYQVRLGYVNNGYSYTSLRLFLSSPSWKQQASYTISFFISWKKDCTVVLHKTSQFIKINAAFEIFQ